MPTVSVVIPTYNRARILGRAVRSVLNQSYKDFEVIVVDDASSDNTKEIVDGLNDKRIKYIRHDKNSGEAAARNTGIQAAGGKYIASHDSDDEWLAGKLERQVMLLESSPREVGLAYTGFWRIEGNTQSYFPPDRIGRIEGDIHRELLRGNFVGTPTTVVKKECFERLGGFDERLRHLVDWEMWIRISELYRFICVNESLVISHGMSDSVSTNEVALIEAHEYILGKHFGKFARDRKVLAGEQYWIGNLLCQIGDVYKGRDYLCRAVKAHPLRPKYLMALLLSLLGKKSYNTSVELRQRMRVL
ncbi:MAG: glycosyltransferase [Planctomycetota bacterium]